MQKNTFGRPRLLSHDEILTGAIEVGLEKLTMKKLAAHLGVGTATLYQYFDGRKSLIRAASVLALSKIPWPKDRGQSWRDLAKDYLRCMSDLFEDQTQIIHNHHSDYGFEVRFKLIEPFLSAMTKRGFKVKDAMRMFNQLGMTAFAGAIEVERQRDYERCDETMAIAAYRQFSKLDSKQFPHVKASLGIFTMSPEQKIDDLLESVLSYFEPSTTRSSPMDKTHYSPRDHHQGD